MEINKEHITGWLKQLQDSICIALEKADGSGKFLEENWKREEGGGGRSRVMKNGSVIEKGGIMFSAVHGETPEFLLKEKQHSVNDKISSGSTFYATGISIVIHPKNPMVPIIHMNIRYFEVSNETKWLGGGIDLTPHYIVKEDANYFHSKLKKVCDRHNSSYYNKFKEWADNYFFIKHRNETRGIGGIFFDRLNAEENMSFEKNLTFWKEVGEAFAPIYCHLINKNKNISFNEDQKKWQLLRRGRYVEFNLIYDKGTKFGLETNGRTESILMSLPALAGWEYNYEPAKNSPEERTQSLLRKGISWI